MEDDPHLAVLAQRIGQGDPAAETELVARCREALRTMLRRRVKDAALADDLCHEVFAIALPALRDGRLREGERLAGYLWGIARHLALRIDRHRAREQARRAEVPEEPPPQEQALLEEERIRLLRQALAELSDRDRDLLTAFYLYDHPKETICRRLRLTPAQFDVIKHRALKRLKAAWRLREVDCG